MRKVKLETDPSLQLSWEVPADDGGKPVINYLIQGKTSSSVNTWRTLLKTNKLEANLKGIVSEASLVRVMAENRIGVNESNDFEVIQIADGEESRKRNHSTKSYEAEETSKLMQVKPSETERPLVELIGK